MIKIKLIVFDVDGTLTDGKIIIDGNGVETKSFYDADGLIMRILPSIGYQTVFLTGRKSLPVDFRARDLHISRVFIGVANKVTTLVEFCNENNINLSQVAYIGNDLNDYAAMKLCGFKACPANSAPEIIRIADFVSHAKGGEGAVREILEYIIKMENLWNDLLCLFGINE